MVNLVCTCALLYSQEGATKDSEETKQVCDHVSLSLYCELAFVKSWRHSFCKFLCSCHSDQEAKRLIVYCEYAYMSYICVCL